MMCCDSTEYTREEINGKCKMCGQPTVNGYAYEICGYSPLVCNTCGWKPCDGSC